MGDSLIEYRSTDVTEVDLIRPLWEQLNDHHRANARAFRDLYSEWTFDDRKKYFTQVAAAGLLRIDLAVDTASGRYIGYCIRSLSPEKKARSNRSLLRTVTGNRDLATPSSNELSHGWMQTVLSGTGPRSQTATKKYSPFTGTSGSTHG